MARPQRPSISQMRPLSADFAPRPRDSMLYSMLPSAVQSRIPHLPSFRRSLSLYKPPTPTHSEHTSGTSTPETGYISAMVLGSSDAGTDNKVAEYTLESASDEDASRPGTAGGESRQQAGLQMTESSTGIEWKFANQGLNLLSLAVDESSTLSRNPGFGNASFARQLYIHALTYLLRALPTDLTSEEQMGIRSSLPAGVVEPSHIDGREEYTSSGQVADNEQPSLLHRTLASTIVQVFVFFQFILPYLRYLLHYAYQYDREHKISEKVVSQGIEIADLFGKQGLQFASAIYGMGDGKVGQLVTETAAWFVEGVAGGIHEGVGEGMVIIGARQSHGLQRK